MPVTALMNRFVFALTLVCILSITWSYVALADGADIGTAKRSFTPEQRAECRYRGLDKAEAWADREMRRVIRCAARFYDGDAGYIIAIGNCESGLEREPDPSSIYHGPMQYLASTYAAQRSQLPAVTRRYEIPRQVHSVRGQLVLATAWITKRSASPWGCA